MGNFCVMRDLDLPVPDPSLAGMKKLETGRFPQHRLLNGARISPGFPFPSPSRSPFESRFRFPVCSTGTGAKCGGGRDRRDYSSTSWASAARTVDGSSWEGVSMAIANYRRLGWHKAPAPANSTCCRVDVGMGR